MAPLERRIDPAALKWQDDGELAPNDVFALICRLRAVEPGEHSNELWRLGQKYPQPPSRSGNSDQAA
jgi:hypothetical protein